MVTSDNFLEVLYIGFSLAFFISQLTNTEDSKGMNMTLLAWNGVDLLPGLIGLYSLIKLCLAKCSNQSPESTGGAWGYEEMEKGEIQEDQNKVVGDRSLR